MSGATEIIQAITGFAEEALYNGYTHSNCLEYLYSLNSNFRTDELGKQIFTTSFALKETQMLKRKRQDELDSTNASKLPRA